MLLFVHNNWVSGHEPTTALSIQWSVISPDYWLLNHRSAVFVDDLRLLSISGTRGGDCCHGDKAGNWPSLEADKHPCTARAGTAAALRQRLKKCTQKCKHGRCSPDVWLDATAAAGERGVNSKSIPPGRA